MTILTRGSKHFWPGLYLLFEFFYKYNPRAHAPLYPRGILETRLRKPGICSRVHFSHTNSVHGSNSSLRQLRLSPAPPVRWESFCKHTVFSQRYSLYRWFAIGRHLGWHCKTRVQQHKNLTQTHFTNIDNTLVMISSSKMHQKMEN